MEKILTGDAVKNKLLELRKKTTKNFLLEDLKRKIRLGLIKPTSFKSK